MEPMARRRVLLLVIVVFALAVMSYWLFVGSRPLVDVSLTQRGSAAEVVYATGIVEPVHWAKIASLQRKRIVEICKCEGEPVQLGDVLVRLDDAEERALLQQLEARLDRLRDDESRTRKLLERGIASRTTYDEILTQIDEHEALIAAQRDRIEDLELKAPIDGVVLRRDGEVGEIAGIGDSEALIWVGKEKPLQVVAEINEDDIANVRAGQAVLLRHESHASQQLTATLSRITPQGDPDTKTFRAYLTLPDDTPLMIGMSVEANIVVRDKEDALLLPAEAVSDKKVQLVQDNRIVLTEVITGIRGVRFIEIVDGVSEGAMAVSPFRSDLSDDARIRFSMSAK